MAETTCGARWPTLTQPMPPAKSSRRLPSTSSTIAPSACAAKMGVAGETPRATAATRRRARSRERGPGIGVRSSIVGISSVPPDRFLVQVDVNLLGLEIFLDSRGAELPTEAGLFVAAPGGFDECRLHVIDPDDPGTEGLHDPECFEDVARPDSSGQAVRSCVGNADCLGFVRERDQGRDGSEDFFLGNAGGVVHVAEKGGLDVVAAGHPSRAPAAGSQL